MSSKEREVRVRTVVSACKERWRSGGVFEDRAQEMGEELEHHLRRSLAAGQSVEDVVGSDLDEFAEEWVAPNQPSKPVGHEILEMFSATSVFVFVVLLALHLWQGSPSLPASWEDLSFFIVLAYAFSMLFARVRRPSGVDSDADVSVWDAYPGWLRVGIISAAILALAYDRFLQSTDQEIFTWPWTATVGVLAASPLLLLLRKVIAGEPMEAYNERLHDEDRYLYGFLEPRDQIELVVKDCVFYWKTDTRIPADRAHEMGEELEQHLWAAVEDGKTVDSVVGPDIDAFAEEWAEEDHPPPTAADRAVEIVFGISAFFTIAAGLGHILGWDLYVPLSWFLVLFLLGVGTWFIQKVIASIRQPQTGNLKKSWLLTATVGLLACSLSAGIALILFVVYEEASLVTSLQWPWYATIASAAVALSMIFLWIRE